MKDDIVEKLRAHLSRQWLVVALILFVLLCVWFSFTGLWEDLQYD